MHPDGGQQNDGLPEVSAVSAAPYTTWSVRSGAWNAGSPVKVFSGGDFNGSGNVTRRKDTNKN